MLLGTPPERKSLLKIFDRKRKKRGEETMQMGVGRGNFCFMWRKRAAWQMKLRFTSTLRSAALRLPRVSTFQSDQSTSFLHPSYLTTRGVFLVE